MTWLRDAWKRLKKDTDLAVISTAGLCGFVGITPFLVFRLKQADWLVAAVDSALLVATLYAVVITWSQGRSQWAGQLLAGVYSVGAIVIAIKLKPYGLAWFYCLILFNFFVIPLKQSVLATLVALGLLCGYGLIYPGTIFSSTLHMLTFISTAIVASLFAFIFAWRTAQQRISLQALADVDPLTGIGNRRTLMNELDAACAAHQRDGRRFGLLLLDLDHFKQINDRHGHAEGDRILIAFVELIRKASRRTDRLFRLGGEEFVLLLSDTDQSGLTVAASNILQAVVNNLRSGDKVVTVSIGGAFLAKGESVEAWLHNADAAMYRAKELGRNQLVIHQTD